MGNDSTTPRTTKLVASFPLVAACFLVSGFAALLYETVWLRQFAILLGTSEQALTVVLASYMAGLGLGSLLASRFVDSLRRPLLTYGLLELGIALAASFVPIGISLASSLQATVLGDNPEPPDAGSLIQIMFCTSVAFGLILVPTVLMGATLPLLARHSVASDAELGPKIGMLYAINTAGAVMGTLVAAFYCLPLFGLARTTWIGVAANVLVFLIVVLMVRRSRTIPQDAEIRVAAGESRKPDSNSRKKDRKRLRKGGSDELPEEDDERRYRWVVWFAATSGAVSFCYEIVFTRMLGQMLGGSVYAFATMLAGFLLGIAIGGALASGLNKRRRIAVAFLIYAQVGTAIACLLTYHVVNAMPLWAWDDMGISSPKSIQVFASIISLVPASTFIGVTFPLAVRIYAKDETEAARASARVYCWNVFGGIFGAMATGAFVLPYLQFHGTIILAVTFNLGLALALTLLFRASKAHLAAPFLVAVLLITNLPRQPENILRVSALSGRIADGEILFNHVGRSATVTVMREQGDVVFQTNGLPESQLLTLGSDEIHRHSGYWLSALPSLVRPGCRSMMIIGLGGGVVAEQVPPSIESFDVLELEPAVVDANRAVALERNYDPFQDPRMKIVINDGRNALALTNKTYDAIVSQPSHPWTAGASHLYSREFAQIIREHLNPGGVFLQWMATDFVDVELFQSMTATVLDAFPHARLYQPTSGLLLFVASDQPIMPEMVSENFGHLQVNDQDRELFQRLGVVTPTHLFSKLSLDEYGLRQIADGAELITDEHNLLAMRAPEFLKQYDQQEVLRQFTDDHSPATRGRDELLRLCPSLDLRVYVDRRISRHAEWVKKHGLPLVTDPVIRSQLEAKVQRSSMGMVAWAQKLRSLAKQYPHNSDLAFELLSNRTLGQEIDLSEDELKMTQEALTSNHRLIIDLLQKLMNGDWASARRYEQELANWPVDDIAYQFAVRLRIPWRLEAPPNERTRRCIEVIRIIDQSAPYANASGLAFFRASAGAKANRPQIVIGTTVDLSRMLRRLIKEQDQFTIQAGASNLVRCYGILRQEAFFQSIPRRRYRSALSEVEETLQSLGLSM